MSSPQANTIWTFSALTWASFNDFTLVLIEIPAPFKKLSTCNVCFFFEVSFPESFSIPPYNFSFVLFVTIFSNDLSSSFKSILFLSNQTSF